MPPPLRCGAGLCLLGACHNLLSTSTPPSLAHPTLASPLPLLSLLPPAAYPPTQVTSGSTGVLLNDEMDDFSTPGLPNAYKLAPSRANFIRPGKRPLSSMSPTIVLQGGEVRAVCGASGGPVIITATLQALLGVIMYGVAPLEAVQSPRLHHQVRRQAGVCAAAVGCRRLLLATAEAAELAEGWGSETLCLFRCGRKELSVPG